MKIAITWIIALTVAGTLGWVAAHTEVATECKKLGSFYVGKVVFSCSVKGE